MSDNQGCCKIEAVVTMDTKGQIVLPKNLRERAKLESGAKLAIAVLEREGVVCCFVMVRAEALGGTVKNMLGTMFQEALE
jgi:antitoxin PrlF